MAMLAVAFAIGRWKPRGTLDVLPHESKAVAE
jgi:hypothetical protein